VIGTELRGPGLRVDDIGGRSASRGQTGVGEASGETAPEVQPHVALVVAEGRAEVAGRGRRSLLAMPGHLGAGAPVAVVQPLLRPLGGHHVLAVRRPLRRHVVLPLVVGELARVGAVGIRDPEVLRTVPVAHEHQHRAVGRISRLHVVALTAGDARRLAAAHRQRVQVAQELEHDGFAIGGQVQGDPRAFVGGELKRPGGDQRQPVRLARRPGRAVVLLFGLRGGGGGQGHNGEDEERCVR
jgi:uncharacterized protein YoaH (UPF0181 family)